MTREEAIEFIAQSVKSDVDMALIADAIKALEQDSTTKNNLGVDAVSRQALIDWLKNWTLGDATPLIDFVNNMPSVTPQEPILDKIRAELHATAEMHEDGDYYLRDEWIDEYFDKYKAESEG